MAETINQRLLRAAKNFVAWADDVWGSGALSGDTLKEYEDAKEAIREAERLEERNL